MGLAAKLICDMFDNVLNLRNASRTYWGGGETRGGHGKGMWMAFLYEDQQLNLCLYAPSTYVGVYAAWSRRNLRVEDVTDWRCVSHHASCWRTDGVERVLAIVEELKLSVRGVHVDVLPDTLVQEFELLARDYEGPHVDRVFLLGPAGW